MPERRSRFKRCISDATGTRTPQATSAVSRYATSSSTKDSLTIPDAGRLPSLRPPPSPPDDMPRARSRRDHLYLQPLGPRELEAVRVIESRPGITVAELQDALGVGASRVWQIVNRLERARVRLEALPDPRWPLEAAARSSRSVPSCAGSRRHPAPARRAAQTARCGARCRPRRTSCHSAARERRRPHPAGGNAAGRQPSTSPLTLMTQRPSRSRGNSIAPVASRSRALRPAAGTLGCRALQRSGSRSQPANACR